MAKAYRTGDIDLNQDLEHEERSDRFALILRFVWVLIVLAAVLGVLGSGPLSHATRTDGAGQLTLEYDRFVRVQSPVKLRLLVLHPAAHSTQLRVWLSRTYLESMESTQVDPTPVLVESAHDKTIYVFQCSTNSRALALNFRFHPERSGLISGKLGILQGPVIGFEQWIYP